MDLAECSVFIKEYLRILTALQCVDDVKSHRLADIECRFCGGYLYPNSELTSWHAADVDITATITVGKMFSIIFNIFIKFAVLGYICHKRKYNQ